MNHTFDLLATFIVNAFGTASILCFAQASTHAARASIYWTLAGQPEKASKSLRDSTRHHYSILVPLVMLVVFNAL